MTESKGNRLTARKMQNSKFRNIEDKLVEAFFEGDRYATTKDISKRADMARSTFYRHHASVSRITSDYKDYLLARYKATVRKLLKNKHTRLKSIYLRTLIFIAKHQREFSVVLRGEDRTVFEEMLSFLRDKIISVTYLPTHSDKAWQVYTAEIVEILWRWGENGFKLTQLNRTLSDIMYLTRTVKARLSAIDAP